MYVRDRGGVIKQRGISNSHCYVFPKDRDYEGRSNALRPVHWPFLGFFVEYNNEASLEHVLSNGRDVVGHARSSK